MAEPTLEQKILKLERENERLKARLANAEKLWHVVKKQRRDTMFDAILGGLAAGWRPDELRADDLVLRAERLADKAFELWLLRAKGESPLDHQTKARQYRRRHPQPAVGAAPTEPTKLAEEFRKRQQGG